jgi:ABC-type transport system substrate-binding protein
MAAAGELALLPGDRWQDGQPVTAREVACSFEASAALNADAPALFVSTPVQVAAASRRVEGLQIDPDSWLSGLPAVSLEA